MSVQWFDRDALQRVIGNLIHEVDVVLDIGCGIRPQEFFKPKLHILCEPHTEYATVLQRKFGQSPDTLILRAVAQDVVKVFPDKSVDSIFMVDLIEHLGKEDGKHVIAECERIARKQIILFTPLGFLAQDYEPGEEDGWGLHGAEWQVHKSGWLPEDFDDSWTILGSREFHSFNAKGEPIDPPAGAFWAVKNLQILTPSSPETSGLPLVSIITPAYNRASCLDETIQSVLKQDYPRTEYIVLDDGSTDNTREVLEKYAGRLVWDSHSNMGETGTVNKGLGMAHGDIVTVVNSDDPLLPGAVSSAVAFMKAHPDVLVAYADWDFIDKDSKVTGHNQVPDYDFLFMVRRHSCIVGPGAFIRRRAFELTGMRDPQFKYVADFEYWLRLGIYGQFARIPKTLATFRVHPDSASVSMRGRNMAEEHIRLMKSFYSRSDLPESVLRVRSEAFSWAHWTAGMVSGPNRWLALRHYFRSVLYRPSTLAAILGLRMVTLVQSLPKPLFRVIQRLWHLGRWPVAGVRRIGSRNDHG